MKYELHLKERRTPTSDPYNAAEPTSRIVERHVAPDLKRLAWLVTNIIECGFDETTWIEIHPVP